MTMDALLERAYRDMDPKTGMFPADWACRHCGRQLNADGNHPAELYAGTFTGLCYRCTALPYFVEATAPLDGALRLNWPPHCPSWRRDRETYIGYADCGTCHGSGVAHNGAQSRRSCRACSDRYYSHPLRRWANERGERIRLAAQATYEAVLLDLAALPRRSSKRARLAAIEAMAKTSLGEEAAVHVRHRASDLMARLGKAKESHGLRWAPYVPEDAEGGVTPAH